MCGRYVVASPTDELAREYGAELAPAAADLKPAYNVAPTQLVPIVLERTDTDADGVRRELHAARWGLIPSWAKDATGAARMINARLDTAGEKPAFRKAMAARRAIFPASGYYEWQKRPDGSKQPYFVHPAGGGLVAMAGLFEWWADPDVPADDPARWVLSATILTTAPTGRPAEVHDRMPAMLDPALIPVWLDRGDDAVGVLTAALRDSTKAIAGRLDIRPVSRAVGNVANDHPGLLEPDPAAT